MTEQQTKTTKPQGDVELNKDAQQHTSRLKFKKGKDKTSSMAKTDQKPRKWVQIRLIPIWLRILLVLLLLVSTVIVGAMFGYSVLGDGEATKIFHKETWTHIVDIMNGTVK